MTTYFNYASKELQDELSPIAKAIVATGKDILATESVATMGKRLKDIGVENSDELRRQYRQLLFSTHPQLSSNIFRLILFQCGIIPGIKIDKSVAPLMGSEDECTAQGLDYLAARCDFAKWRCVLKTGKDTPSYQSILENANVLARYASICQSQAIIQIVEPEVLPEDDHDLDRAQKATETILAASYKALNDHHVFLEHTLLKPKMVTAGQSCAKKYFSQEVALATVTALRRTVPAVVPGITFLSDGQSDHLCGFERHQPSTNVEIMGLHLLIRSSLQDSALCVWAGRKENVGAGQTELLNRAKGNGEAAIGKYVAGSVVGASPETNQQQQ